MCYFSVQTTKTTKDLSWICQKKNQIFAACLNKARLCVCVCVCGAIWGLQTAADRTAVVEHTVTNHRHMKPKNSAHPRGTALWQRNAYYERRVSAHGDHRPVYRPQQLLHDDLDVPLRRALKPQINQDNIFRKNSN